MNGTTLTLKAWLALFGALVCWCGVAFFLFYLVTMHLERAEHVRNAVETNQAESQAALLRALARETAFDRAALMSSANTDVLSAVNIIESVRSGAVQVQVANAQAEKLANAKAGSSTVNVILLSVRAEGSFQTLMHIVQMLESLPIATTIQEIDIQKISSDDTKAKIPTSLWTLSVRLRFLTTVALPS